MSETTPETSELRERLAEHQYDPANGWRCTCGEDFADRMDFTRPLQAAAQFADLLATHQADALLPVVAQEIAAAEQRGRAEALREAADEIVRELICCDVFERRESGHRHQICYWAGASRQLVLDRAALAEPAAEEHK